MLSRSITSSSRTLASLRALQTTHRRTGTTHLPLLPSIGTSSFIRNQSTSTQPNQNQNSLEELKDAGYTFTLGDWSSSSTESANPPTVAELNDRFSAVIQKQADKKRNAKGSENGGEDEVSGAVDLRGGERVILCPPMR